MSTHPVAADAAGEAIASVLEQLGEQPVDLAVLFVAGGPMAQMGQIVEAVHRLIAPETLIGCTAIGSIGGGLEAENGPSVSIWAGATGPVIPVRMEALHPRPDTPILGVPEELDDSTMLLLAEPFSFPMDALFGALPQGVPVLGGLASASNTPGGNRLWLNDEEFTEGAVGVLLPSDTVTPVVSQGCRPIGEPWVITKAERNLMHELAGVPAMERLQALIEELSPADRECAARGLHIGIVANEQREAYTQGDFLIRGVMGVERDSGAIAVSAIVEVGQLVQFQVRDAESASADLAHLMVEGDGALVFTCNGRGTHMFHEPHQDALVVQELTRGGVAGMFCAGEIGPIGIQNAVHGFTATVAVFHG